MWAANHASTRSGSRWKWAWPSQRRVVPAIQNSSLSFAMRPAGGARVTSAVPDYTTDPFFGLEDRWLETAPGELAHYHDLDEGAPVLFRSSRTRTCTSSASAATGPR